MSDIDYVREGFARGWQGDGSMVGMDEAFADNEREFDKWLANHDAEVAKAAKVEALREAADSIEGGNLSEPVARKEPSTMGYNLGREDAVKLLRHRADRIEAGEGA